MNTPFVTVVTGRPGSGKTTLAHLLAQRIHCPVLCRDEFKEGYVHTLGGTHASLGQDINRQVYDVFFESVNFVVSKGVSVVIEAAFQHRIWAPKLTQLAEIAAVRIVVCAVEPQLAQSRWTERAAADAGRERFHGEQIAQQVTDSAARLIDAYEPPALDLPLLTVDTTNGYHPGMEQIVAFAMQGFANPAE